MNIQTLKGFRDFLASDAKKRQYVMTTLRKVFESYGFEPIETPTLEYEELLSGKYGDEGDKLMYKFEDNGKRGVAMRYDLTVPLSRVVAQYQNTLPTPFKRYQMQSVWRADNTQKGRFREFTQCDLDIVGATGALSDAETVSVIQECLTQLRFKNTKILLNDRSIFEGLPIAAITAIDKLEKIGEDGVCDELVERNITKSREEAYNLLQSITQKQPTEKLNEIFTTLERLGIAKENYSFSPTLARGLDYYTGLIFEIKSPDYPYGSLGGGGRYDNLIGMFLPTGRQGANRQIPAVGGSFGLDRIIEAMEALDLFPKELNEASAKVLVTIFNRELEPKSLELASRLREVPSGTSRSSKNINVEIWLDPDSKMEKQLKYADTKGIPYVVILGLEEVEKNVITLKNLKTREQKQLPLDELVKELLQ